MSNCQYFLCFATNYYGIQINSGNKSQTYIYYPNFTLWIFIKKGV